MSFLHFVWTTLSLALIANLCQAGKNPPSSAFLKNINQQFLDFESSANKPNENQQNIQRNPAGIRGSTVNKQVSLNSEANDNQNAKKHNLQTSIGLRNDQTDNKQVVNVQTGVNTVKTNNLVNGAHTTSTQKSTIGQNVPSQPTAKPKLPVDINSQYNSNFPALPTGQSNVKQLVQMYNSRDDEARRAESNNRPHKYSQVVAGTHKNGNNNPTSHSLTSN